MATFAEDFWANFRNNLLQKQGSVPADLSSAYALYVGLTNAGIGSPSQYSYAGKLVQVARVAEAAAVSLALIGNIND